MKVKKKRKRKIFKSSDTITYKFPVILGNSGEEFYNWINNAKSINGLITESLKLKFMMEQLDLEKRETEMISSKNHKAKNITRNVLDLDMDIVDEGDMELDIFNTFNSIRR